MLVHLLKSKIHRARITGASPDLDDSLTLPIELMEKAGMHPHERVLCSNLSNGERFETVLLPGDVDAVILNGAIAHLGKIGHRLTIMTFTEAEEGEAITWQPLVIVLGEKNTVTTEGDEA